MINKKGYFYSDHHNVQHFTKNNKKIAQQSNHLKQDILNCTVSGKGLGFGIYRHNYFQNYKIHNTYNNNNIKKFKTNYRKNIHPQKLYSSPFSQTNTSFSKHDINFQSIKRIINQTSNSRKSSINRNNTSASNTNINHSMTIATMSADKGKNRYLKRKNRCITSASYSKRQKRTSNVSTKFIDNGQEKEFQILSAKPIQQIQTQYGNFRSKTGYKQRIDNFTSKRFQSTFNHQRQSSNYNDKQGNAFKENQHLSQNLKRQQNQENDFKISYNSGFIPSAKLIKNKVNSHRLYVFQH